MSGRFQPNLNEIRAADDARRTDRGGGKLIVAVGLIGVFILVPLVIFLNVTN